MADVISRLKLESGEFDSKIKRAGQELMAYSEHCKKMGLEMGYANKDAKDFAKALGSMQTTSSSARGKINELTEAFVNLKVMYKNMTDEEKNNAFGKNLAASLDQLKTRIDQAKAELNSVNAELGNTKQAEVDTKGGLEGLTNALGINVKTLVGWGSALAAGKMALDVAKDAFFSSETNVDDWGRTVAASQSLYEGFVASLNTGDFSGFFTNIDNITKAAKEAYNALDELGTRMTIINPERAKLQARQEELRATIRTKGADSTEGKRAAAELKKLQSQLSKTYSSESTMNRNAFEKLVRQRMTEGGINLNERSFKEFMKTFDSDASFQQFRNRAKGSIKTIQSSSSGTSSSGAVQTYSRTVDTRNTEKKLMDIFTDEWRKKNSGYLTASYMAQGAASSNALGNARYLREKASGKGGKGGKTGKTDIQYADDSIMAQEKLVSDLTKKWKTASGELRDGYLKDLEEAQEKLAEMTGKAKGPDLDAMFPDMSKENYNTGYAGSAQAKYDSARADLALGPMNFDAINDYIGSIKGMLKDADLGSELYNNMTEKLKDATTVSTLLQEMMERGLAGADLESTAQALKEKLLSREGIDQTTVQSFLDELNKQIEEAGGVGLKLNADTGEVTDKKGKDDGLKESFGKFKEFASGLNQVASGLQQMGVQLPKGVSDVLGVVNGVISVIQGISTIIGVFQTSAITANTIALGALTSAVTANTFAKFLPFFSGGGIVPAFAQGGTIPKFAEGRLIGRAAGGMTIPGNSMSGDLLRMPVDGGRGMIGVNSGELILNKSSQNSLAASLLQAESLVDSIRDYRVSLGNAQQGVLADALGDGSTPNINIDWVLKGDALYAVMNNNGRRTGRGELVQRNRI